MRETVRSRLDAGDRLHMQLVEGRRIWWFEEPYQSVPGQIIAELEADGQLVECGDSLFGLAGNSQSWGGGGRRVR